MTDQLKRLADPFRQYSSKIQATQRIIDGCQEKIVDLSEWLAESALLTNEDLVEINNGLARWFQETQSRVLRSLREELTLTVEGKRDELVAEPVETLGEEKATVKIKVKKSKRVQGIWGPVYKMLLHAFDGAPLPDSLVHAFERAYPKQDYPEGALKHRLSISKGARLNEFFTIGEDLSREENSIIRAQIRKAYERLVQYDEKTFRANETPGDNLIKIYVQINFRDNKEVIRETLTRWGIRF